MRTWFLLCCWLGVSVVSAQTAVHFFKPIPESAIVLTETAQRKLIPLRYQTYRLDYSGIKVALESAPWEFTPAARAGACVIGLPATDGTMEEFAVWQTAMMEPALAEQVPYIRTFAGVSLSNPGKTVHFSHTLRGFRAMVLQPDFGVQYVEPYAWGQDEFYMVYDRNDISENDRQHQFTGIQADPTLLDEPSRLFTPAVEDRGTLLDPVKLKVYRFIVSTTGEFGQDHGDTKPIVFSAVAEYTNQVNAIFERDLAIRLQLIQASLVVCFFDPNTDPFNGVSPSDFAGQNQQALDAANIPSSVFDVGHVYARGGGGVKIGATCTNGKAAGCTAGQLPYGDGFIGVICQEVGHQMSGGHTWNRCGGGAPDQRAGGTAYEPGSGSTVMSYAGGCGPDNVQNFMDLYFHGGSIEEIRSFVVQGTGNQCGSLVQTDNTPPEVTLPYQNNFFIPIGTPFELNGSATDANGDALTYCWEQVDLGPEAPLESPVASSPLFRTLPAVSVTNRYFPKLTTVLSNGTDIREQLPGWTRDMTFRLTARDNRPGGGGVSWATVAFKAWGDAGPFTVQYPNTATDVWHIGEFANVTWDVSNTDKSPVNCQRVNIRLSTDGGFTYPITLASNVGNDGNHYVKVPDLPTGQARVRIDGADNVFYDISNKNFKIQQPAQPSFTMGLVNDSGILCLPADHTVEVQTAGVLGFNSPVNLEIVGALPANVGAEWSATTIAPGETATLKLDFSQVDVEDVFTITVRAEAGGVEYLRDIVLTTLRNDFSALALVAPANGATGLQLTQTLHWTKALDALTYTVQFATSPSFEPGTILASTQSTTLDSFKLPVFLAKGTPYFWRVRPANECGLHDWSDPFFFSTFPENCVVREANDLPKNMTSNGKPVIESKITVNSGGAIKNMEIRQLKGYHEFFKDLDVHLISPQGTDITLWTAKCGNYNGVFNLRLTDEAPNAFACPPPTNGAAYRPQNPLAPLIGENSTGTWTLRAGDTEIGGGGVFEAFQLEFCSEVTVNPPYLVNNNPLLLAPGTNAGIEPGLLLVEDANNTHSQLKFTLVSAPKHGELHLGGVGLLKPGAQFTQADIDNGGLRYFDYATNTGGDGFHFMVTDGEGGFFGTPRFVIQPFPVGSSEPTGPAFGFNLYPNPANDAVWVAADQAPRSELRVTLFNTAGQLMLESRLPAGAERVLLDTAGLPRGIYLVEVQGTVRKLVLR